MELLLHPVTVTLLMSAVLIALHVVGQIAIAKLTPEEAKKWPVLAQAAFITVLTSVAVIPTITNLWAERRDEQSERRAQQRDRDSQRLQVRAAHLDRLRPLLLSDSRKLLQLSNQLAIEGTAIGGFLIENYEQPLDQTYWYPEVLYRDLATHFPTYGKIRDRLRGEVLAQQKDTVEIQRLAMDFAKTEPPDEVIAIALTIAKHCTGIGKGMSLEVDPAGGYLYTDDGAPQRGSGDPPAGLIRRIEAYKAFKPTESFSASCSL
jgi:hypothetical protein